MAKTTFVVLPREVATRECPSVVSRSSWRPPTSCGGAIRTGCVLRTAGVRLSWSGLATYVQFNSSFSLHKHTERVSERRRRVTSAAEFNTYRTTSQHSCVFFHLYLV